MSVSETLNERLLPVSDPVADSVAPGIASAIVRAVALVYSQEPDQPTPDGDPEAAAGDEVTTIAVVATNAATAIRMSGFRMAGTVLGGADTVPAFVRTTTPRKT